MTEADSYDAATDGFESYHAAIDAMRDKLESFPRVELGPARLYLGDCREILPLLPRVAAVVTDPPYCSGGFSESAKQAAKGMGLRGTSLREVGWFINDNMTSAGLCWLMSFVSGWSRRIVAPGGTFTAFTDWRMVPQLAPAIESAGWRYQNMLVWAKPSPGLGIGFRAQHEIALHFASGTPVYHSASNGNVLTFQRVSAADREHQTEKPLGLISAIIQTVSAPGDVILDPFMGSGTTGVACAAMGRKFIGIEIDSTNFETARRRIADEVGRPRLDLGAVSATQEGFDL